MSIQRHVFASELTRIKSYQVVKINTTGTPNAEIVGVQEYHQGSLILGLKYRVILSVLDPRKCEYLKDYSLDFEHAYMTTYLAS